MESKKVSILTWSNSYIETPLWLHIKYSFTVSLKWRIVPQGFYGWQNHCAASVAARHLCLAQLRFQVWRNPSDSVVHWPLEQLLELCLGRGLFLLQEISVAFGDTPAVGGRHGGTQGTTGSRLQVLPVVTTGSEWDTKARILVPFS